MNSFKNESKNVLRFLKIMDDFSQEDYSHSYQSLKVIKDAIHQLQDDVQDHENCYQLKRSKLKIESTSSSEIITNLNSWEEVNTKTEETLQEINGLNKLIELEQIKLNIVSKEEDNARKHPAIMLPKIKDEYKLLAKLFMIKWDYNSSELVRGYIVNSCNQEFIPFDLDQNQSSQHFITNYLWQQMAEAEFSSLRKYNE